MMPWLISVPKHAGPASACSRPRSDLRAEPNEQTTRTHDTCNEVAIIDIGRQD